MFTHDYGTINHCPNRKMVRRRLLVWQVLLALMLISLWGQPNPAAAGPPPPNASLRLMTYNTAFVSADVQAPVGIVDVNDGTFSGLDYEARAHKIADGILRGDNDVVALNEVFSDDARAILVSRLSDKYKHYIARVKAPPVDTFTVGDLVELLVGGDLPDLPVDFLDTLAVNPADSGLMIFSIHPFVKFTASASPPYDATEVSGRKGPLQTWGKPDELAFSRYTACESDDCFASKGIAMVRIQAPAGIVNVAFTHMQADYPPFLDGQATRAKQYSAIRSLITNSLTTAELNTQPVYVMGDLNTPGHNKFPGGGAGASEWAQRYDPANNPSGFYNCGSNVCTFDPLSVGKRGSFLTDSWGFETSHNDKGVTNYDDDARLDYILHSNPRDLCMQHIMIAYDLGEQGGLEQFSDHLGIRADFNREARFCSPDDAAGLFGPKLLNFDAAQHITLGTADGVRITHPGSMQWFKIDKAGTYTFAGAPNIGLDVYASTNLSAPVPAYEVLDEGRKFEYALPDPPYYIRTYAKNALTGAPDRAWTGNNYTLEFHEHRGLTQGDALILRAGSESEYAWPVIDANTIMTPDQKVWFKFRTDTSTGGAFPEVSFLQENTTNTHAPDSFTLTLLDGTPAVALPTTVIQDLNSTALFDFDDDYYHDQAVIAPPLAGNPDGPKKYFVTLQRDDSLSQTPLTSILEFRTTLTYIRSYHIFADEENTWGPAEDDLQSQWSYDNDPGAPVPCATATCLGPFYMDDQQHWYPAEAEFHQSFVAQLVPSLWDDAFDGDADYLEPQYGAAIAGLYHGTAGVAEGKFVWADSTDENNKDDAGHWYTMSYWLGHEPDLVNAHQPGQ